MGIIFTLIGYVLMPLWIIAFYEVGKKYHYQDWKRLLALISFAALYLYVGETRADPDTRISPEFDFDYYLKIFIPTLVSFLTGVYLSKKNKGDKPHQVLKRQRLSITVGGMSLHPKISQLRKNLPKLQASKQAEESVRLFLAKSMKIQQCTNPPQELYGFSPDDDLLFTYQQHPESSIGGTEYIAVYRETGVARYLGHLGE